MRMSFTARSKSSAVERKNSPAVVRTWWTPGSAATRGSRSPGSTAHTCSPRRRRIRVQPPGAAPRSSAAPVAGRASGSDAEQLLELELGPRDLPLPLGQPDAAPRPVGQPVRRPVEPQQDARGREADRQDVLAAGRGDLDTALHQGLAHRGGDVGGRRGRPGPLFQTCTASPPGTGDAAEQVDGGVPDRRDVGRRVEPGAHAGEVADEGDPPVPARRGDVGEGGRAGLEHPAVRTAALHGAAEGAAQLVDGGGEVLLGGGEQDPTPVGIDLRHAADPNSRAPPGGRSSPPPAAIGPGDGL